MGMGGQPGQPGCKATTAANLRGSLLRGCSLHRNPAGRDSLAPLVDIGSTLAL